jgi:predicted transposase/invertase (TIGR01784 family)
VGCAKKNSKGGMFMSCKNKQYTEEIFRTLRALRLVDNDLMEACFKDNLEAADLLLKIILDRKDLTVTGVSTQYHIAGFQNHNVCLDIYATDIEGNKYNIEVQRANKGAEPQRARYYSSMIDTDMLMHGQDYDQLRENYVIFITENDVFRLN